MKKLINFTFCFFFFIINLESQQSIECIDSLFVNHFSSLEKEIICEEYILVPKDDITFVNLLAILTNYNIKIFPYSGHPYLNNEELAFFREWYIEKKHKLECEKIKKALDILTGGLTIKELEFLDSLKSEINN
jgi:hypothetical protein